jgi:Fe-S oxidoreductase
MRIKPRASKRHVFSCTQCTLCIQACAQQQSGDPRGSLLSWVEGACAEDTAWGGFGPRPVCTDPACHLLRDGEERLVRVTKLHIDKRA